MPRKFVTEQIGTQTRSVCTTCRRKKRICPQCFDELSDSVRKVFKESAVLWRLILQAQFSAVSDKKEWEAYWKRR